MKTFLKNLLLPNVDSIMSTFTKTIKALEAKSEMSAQLGTEYRIKANDAFEESDRAHKLAVKLKSAFTI